MSRQVKEVNRVCFYFMVAFIVKIFLSAITPFSLDLIGNILYSRRSWQAVLSSGFYAPWFAFMKGITSLWAVLFMQHTSLENSIGYWYIAPNLSVTALLMMQKAPLLIFDAATAVMIGRVVAEYGSAHAARGAVLLWLINPYVTLSTEMWGTWDIVSGFFLLLAVAYFAKGRFLESGISLGLGIGLKMYPLLSLPVFLMFLTREKLRSSLRFIAGVGVAYFATGGVTLILAAESHLTPSGLTTNYLVATSAELSENVMLLSGYGLVSHGIQISILAVAVVLFVFGYFLLWKPGRTGILEAVVCVYMLIFGVHVLVHTISSEPPSASHNFLFHIGRKKTAFHRVHFFGHSIRAAGPCVYLDLMGPQLLLHPQL